MKDLTLLQQGLRSQYVAALAMLRHSIAECPDSLWTDARYKNTCWQLAYHTLYFAHLYMMPRFEEFVPFEGHQNAAQYDDCIPGTPDPDSPHPLLPAPYSKEHLLRYCDDCMARVDERVAALELTSEESGFSWYKVSKFEHQLVNLRHIQHGAAQLADRLRTECNAGVMWVGSGDKWRARQAQ